MNTLQRFGPTDRLRLLESVAVHANDAVLITEAAPTDEPGPRILYVNSAFERMTGYASADVVGKTPRILQGPLTSGAARRSIREALAAWKPLQIDLLNYRADGRPFWVEISLVPVADETGWYTHWLSVQREVTARRDAAALADHAEYVEAQNVRLSMEIAERQLAESKLAYAAYHDDLTGLHNRAAFQQRLDTALARADLPDGARACVLFFDLDRFKIVNDTLGHATGDLMLRRVAESVRSILDDRDVFARMGGDEFAVLLEEPRSRSVEAVAEAILTTLREPITLRDVAVFANASIGVAHRFVGTGEPEGLLRDADMAMYRAKRDGGDRYAGFDASMERQALRTAQLYGELRAAVANERFVVQYQPIERLSDGATVGCEALVRWNHPDRGLVAPSEFIPLAEETGLIVPLGTFVLRTACATMMRWRRVAPGREHLRMNVNVSTLQLRDANFLTTLLAVLAETRLPPEALQIEITETVFAEDGERIGALIEAVRDLGVTVAVDDFGSGYSSLSYLERFPVDVLKIDRSFVARLCESQRTVDVMRTIVELGRVLGLDVLAEGIEDAAQRRLCLEMGCRYAQGYLYSKPVFEAEMASLLGRTELVLR